MSSTEAVTTRPRGLPRLLPLSRAARIVLLALVALGFMKGAIWGTTTPNIWGPDEDYHFLYADGIADDARIIDPDRPLYSDEYSITARITRFDDYGQGPRTKYFGNPKFTLNELDRLPDDARDQTAIGRGIGVVHPPLYHLVAAAGAKTVDSEPFPTRMYAMRLISAAFGALGVFATWLLASQLFRRREGPALLAAGFVAVQPMLGYYSGLVNHDIALVALYTLAIAVMAFVVRTAPRAAQGAAVGVCVSAAMLVKSSAGILLFLAAAAFLLQGVLHGRWRTVLRSGALAVAVIAVLTGWWYVRSRVVYGSFTGVVVGEGGPVEQTSREAGLGQLQLWARDWIGQAYKTTFFHFEAVEAPQGGWLYYLPAACFALGFVGVLAFLIARLRTWRTPTDARIAQLLLLAAAGVATGLPFLAMDVMRLADGSAGFLNNNGRYALPGYPSLVVLAVFGGRWILRAEVRAAAGAAIGAFALWFCWTVWRGEFVNRYFESGPLEQQLRRMSFDRPEAITQTSLTVMLVLFGVLALVAALGWLRLLRSPRGPTPNADRPVAAVRAEALAR